MGRMCRICRAVCPPETKVEVCALIREAIELYLQAIPEWGARPDSHRSRDDAQTGKGASRTRPYAGAGGDLRFWGQPWG